MNNNYLFETKIIYENDVKFPHLLKFIKNNPQKLYVTGNIDILNKPAIAIVGSRNYSEYGKRMTKKFTSELVNEGFVIVSGLAVGIDSFAHRECICSGGKTIAVIASGFENIYPEENIDLYKDILKSGGCIISEYSPETEAKKMYFPGRNRLISGLSLGTLVIEANYRSGTSITAKHCLEQKRKLFCIPNKKKKKNATGTNNLIKNGASLVTNIEDIIDEIGQINDRVKVEKSFIKKEYKEQKMSDKELVIYNSLKNGPKYTDEIVDITGFQITDVNIILSILEINNYIVKISSNMYKVRKND